MKKIVLSLVMTLFTATAQCAEKFVTFNPSAGELLISCPQIVVSSTEHSCVKKAAENLAADWLKVTGEKASLILDSRNSMAKRNSASQQSGASQQNGSSAPRAVILIGTVGSSKAVDQWVKEGRLKDLKGKNEKFIITTIDGQLVIAGSDKRGTVFGIYEMTKQMGVSPWYYWADVPVEHHDKIGIKSGDYTDGEPAVKYRGIFLNDEAPCLTSWVKNTFGTNYGDHRFYEKVFELILRLKGNFMWPAMWSWAFYADDPENSKTADEMGIIMGTSHHEPMARNHQEYARKRGEWGVWNYQKNQQKLDQFFREGIERIKDKDDIVTIGMRGDGDEAMSEDADTRLLERIVKNQRKIISQVTGKKASKTPQVWALYKEVQDYYDKGMRVPDDVLILLCDDNWGNLRRVPNEKERQHPGGWGLYYHVDYVGAPRNSKWLNVTPIQNMWEQLTLAADKGLDRMWILNVGDLKPMEYPITMFMDMAWNPREYGTGNITDHTLRFCREVFGEKEAAEAARLLNICCKYNGRSTAEMLNAETYNVETGEWRRVADDYMRLEAEALRQFVNIDEKYRDAYQQLILFPIQAMANLHQMYYAQAMNRMLAERKNPEANMWADRVEEAFRRDSMLCAAYNHDIAGGKWNGMMTQKHIGYTIWNDDFPADRMPEVTRVEEKSDGCVFEASKGFIAMEAEHFWKAENAPKSQWTVIPDMGRTKSGITLMPYTEETGDASLTYKFKMNCCKQHADCKKHGGCKADSVKIHVVVKSTLDYLNKGSLVYSVSLDGQPAERIRFNERLNEKKENIYDVFYPTVARRVVESVITLPMSSAEEHQLVLHPEDPAIVFEKIVIDAGGYKPQFLFGEESPFKVQ